MVRSSAQAEEGQDEHDHDDQADDIDDAVHGVAPLDRTDGPASHADRTGRRPNSSTPGPETPPDSPTGGFRSLIDSAGALSETGVDGASPAAHRTRQMTPPAAALREASAAPLSRAEHDRMANAIRALAMEALE